VEPEALVAATQVVELRAKSRSEAIRELVLAGNWEKEGVAPEAVVQAIEDREATAQTLVAPDMALPHATVHWPGDYRVVLGRSRRGVPYGAAGDAVHLVVLLVVGSRGGEQRHLEILAQLAKLLRPMEFRQALARARNVKEILRLLTERARRRPAERAVAAEVARANTALVQQAGRLAELLTAQALLLAVERSDTIPWDALAGWTGRLLVVTTESGDEAEISRPDTYLFDVPHANLSRMDLANMGVLLAAANGLANDHADVVCVTGPPKEQLDCISVTKPGAHFRAMFSGKRGAAGRIAPAVILRVLSLAVELASEGREARPIGAMFVIGDTTQVMRFTQQLVLNPFHGFARRLRNVLDPSLAETIKEFALLDGAFIIGPDGTALSAGTYLVPESRVELPGGLGTRHQAAAGITADTRALAITVSESTGTVTVFQEGAIVLTLQRAMMTRW